MKRERNKGDRVQTSTLSPDLAPPQESTSLLNPNILHDSATADLGSVLVRISADIDFVGM